MEELYIYINLLILAPLLTIRSAQRLALPAGGWDETRRQNGKTQSREKCLKTRRVPTCPLHAMLGNHELARTLAIKKAQSLTDKFAA